MKSDTFHWPRLLFWLVLTELILGGGGRLVSFGPVSIRMILFALVQLTLIANVVRGKWSWKVPYWQFILVFFGITGISAWMGWQNNAVPSAIFRDVKPLLYWINLAFFGYVIRDLSLLPGIRFVVKWSTFTLAAAYLLLLVFWQTNMIDGEALYLLLSQTEEFSFRGSLGFMYKGFVFLPIGIFFWFQEAGFRKYIVIFLLYLAILLTYTRGFWALCFALQLMYTLFYNRMNILSWLALLFMVVSMYSTGVYVASMSEAYFAGQEVGERAQNQEKMQQPLSKIEKEISSSFKQGFEHREASMVDRFIQIREVIDATTIKSALVGHGLGIGTANRPVHMEISYLEIFHKQGLLGLSLWLVLFLAIARRYYLAIHKKIRSIDYRDDSFVLFTGCIFMFGISFLNPFINAPMGLGWLALSLVLLDQLQPSKKAA